MWILLAPAPRWCQEMTHWRTFLPSRSTHPTSTYPSCRLRRPCTTTTTNPARHSLPMIWTDHRQTMSPHHSLWGTATTLPPARFRIGLPCLLINSSTAPPELLTRALVGRDPCLASLTCSRYSSMRGMMETPTARVRLGPGYRPSTCDENNDDDEQFGILFSLTL